MLKAPAIAETPMRILRVVLPGVRRRRAGFGILLLSLFWALALTACSGPQSALDPAGDGARRIAGLFWVMVGGAALIWILVIGAVFYATRVAPERRHGERTGSLLLLWGGLVVPTAVLAGLLTWGLALMADLRAPGDGLEIAVSGEQWWWRVDYHRAGARRAGRQRQRGAPAQGPAGRDRAFQPGRDPRVLDPRRSPARST